MRTLNIKSGTAAPLMCKQWYRTLMVRRVLSFHNSNEPLPRGAAEVRTCLLETGGMMCGEGLGTTET